MVGRVVCFWRLRSVQSLFCAVGDREASGSVGDRLGEPESALQQAAAKRSGPLQTGLEPSWSRAGPPEAWGGGNAGGPVPFPSSALLLVRALPETQTFIQTERAGRSQVPDHEWGAR